jgi:hypothetical protein
MTDQELYTILWLMFVVGWFYTLPDLLGFPEDMYEEDLWF